MNRESTSDYMNRLVREQRENPDILDFARILGVPAITCRHRAATVDQFYFGGCGMSGHTPGPWSVGGITDTNGGDWTVVTGRFVVASVHNGVDFSPAAVGIPTSRQRANARLIAAAPELLDALEMLLTIDNMTGTDSIACLKQAQAAIAKATT